jgi:hypothetical protein
MDRRKQRKLQDKKRKRDLAKKKKRAAQARRRDPEVLLVNAAARGPFGPCAISNRWDAEGDEPELVSLVVTRRLPDGDLVPLILLVDRTCLGVKDAFVAEKLDESDLDQLLEQIGEPHGGMSRCELLVAQSVVFHAIDYARRLGFEPHRSFPEALVEPRPAELMATPWHARERPLYVAGPHDDLLRILEQIHAKVGENFDFVEPLLLGSEDEDEDEDDDEDDDDESAAGGQEKG